MVEQWFRGGLFHSVNRFAKDNENTWITKIKREEPSFLKYSDVNNLHG